jgi:hypothetical protein
LLSKIPRFVQVYDEKSKGSNPPLTFYYLFNLRYPLRQCFIYSPLFSYFSYDTAYCAINKI